MVIPTKRIYISKIPTHLREIGKLPSSMLLLQKYRPCPSFVVKEMESTYIEELKSTVSLLMANLESVPVAKGGSGDSKYSLNKFKRYNK